MASIRQRHNKWEARVRVPRPVRLAHGGPELLYRTLRAIDKRGAKDEASIWEVGLRAEWALRMGSASNPAIAAIRDIYQSTLERAERGELGDVAGYAETADPLDGGIAYPPSLGSRPNMPNRTHPWID